MMLKFHVSPLARVGTMSIVYRPVYKLSIPLETQEMSKSLNNP